VQWEAALKLIGLCLNQPTRSVQALRDKVKSSTQFRTKGNTLPLRAAFLSHMPCGFAALLLIVHTPVISRASEVDAQGTEFRQSAIKNAAKWASQDETGSNSSQWGNQQLTGCCSRICASDGSIPGSSRSRSYGANQRFLPQRVAGCGDSKHRVDMHVSLFCLT
jgi:hypothetical protein